MVERAEIGIREEKRRSRMTDSHISDAQVERTTVSIKNSQLVLPKAWDLIARFADDCKLHGWKVYENEDVIEAENEFHKFIWVNRLQISTFKCIVANPLCALCEGASYRIVRLSYVAWVLPGAPWKSTMQIVKETPGLSSKVALYDLSWWYKGAPLCLSLNKTESRVFQEFERFLNAEYGIKPVPFSK
ncbi:MAG TPA: hypothetical protein VIH48_00060 [Candidatus Bathyarchaeia archaeon]